MVCTLTAYRLKRLIMDQPTTDAQPTPQREQQPRYPKSVCRGCPTIYQPWRFDQLFHSEECKRRWWSRARVRGAMAYQLLYEWRKTRGQGSGKGKLSDIAHIVDQWIAEDRETGAKR